MAYESEAMIPTENEVTSHRRATFNLNDNEELLATSLDLLEEVRDIAHMRVTVYQQRVVRYYNRMVLSLTLQCRRLSIAPNTPRSLHDE